MKTTVTLALLSGLLGAAGLPSLRAGEPTFSEHIAPMIHRECTSCHRPDQAAPFSLIAFDDVRKHAKTIRRVIDDRYMPPWHPVSGHGEFIGERRLTDDEISLFNRWMDAGQPEGDPALMPEPPQFASGWQLGEPDLVVTMDRAFEVPADGPDVYRNFVVPLNLDEDRWIKAVELRPSARSPVHHVLYFLDDSGTARERDGSDGQAGFRGMGFPISGRLGGYVPGSVPAPLPEDLALALPKGSDLVLQTHFHPTGKAESERMTVGFHFADTAPSKSIVNIQVPPGFGRGMGIDIPPNESNYRVEDTFTLPADVVAYSVSGHAHYICREMKMTATLPDGTERPLLYIDDWDLNWQDRYTFKEPVPLPAGTVLKTELVYDNSENNPDNPFDPPRRIKWGRESTDEMGSITLQVTAAAERDSKLLNASARLKEARAGGQLLAAGIEKLLDQLPAFIEQADHNRDGTLQESEVPERLRKRLFENWDTDKNGELEPAEIEALDSLIKELRRRKHEERA